MRARPLVGGVWLTVLTFAGVALAAPTATPVLDGGSSAPVLASLARTACFGHCPIYQVTVRTDGTVEYDGERFVKVVGHRTAKVDAQALQALRAAFTDAHFLSLQGEFDCYDVTDNPSAIVTYRSGEKERTIRHYHGCRKAPPALRVLEDRIDALLHTDRWISGAGKQK